MIFTDIENVEKGKYFITTENGELVTKYKTIPRLNTIYWKKNKKEVDFLYDSEKPDSVIMKSKANFNIKEPLNNYFENEKKYYHEYFNRPLEEDYDEDVVIEGLLNKVIVLDI